jgi:hypothetical protein
MQKMLKSILGEEGLESLEKAIVKQRGRAVVDPLEFYLPLLVAPRAILAWLIQNVKPMKPGESQMFPFPGRPEIRIEVQKDDIDLYRATFVSKGRIIHEFEKQTLPAFSAHLMTLGEDYESFLDKPEQEKQSSPDIVKLMMNLGGVNPQPQHADAMMASHGNIKDLIATVGKLVDALVTKKSNTDEIDRALDAPKMKVEEDEDTDEEDSELKKETIPEAKVELEPSKVPVKSNRLAKDYFQTKKAEMPSGAGMANAPKQPNKPQKPIQPNHNPQAAANKQAGQAQKQALMAAKGMQKPPQTPGALKVQSTAPKQAPKAPAQPKPLALKQVTKSEKLHFLTEEELYSPCDLCGKSEFQKTEKEPKFSPCDCYSVLANEKDQFVRVIAKNDNSYKIIFSESAEPDAVKAFLLTLKASLMLSKRGHNG